MPHSDTAPIWPEDLLTADPGPLAADPNLPRPEDVLYEAADELFHLTEGLIKAALHRYDRGDGLWLRYVLLAPELQDDEELPPSFQLLQVEKSRSSGGYPITLFDAEATQVAHTPDEFRAMLREYFGRPDIRATVQQFYRRSREKRDLRRTGRVAAVAAGS